MRKEIRSCPGNHSVQEANLAPTRSELMLVTWRHFLTLYLGHCLLESCLFHVVFGWISPPISQVAVRGHWWARLSTGLMIQPKVDQRAEFTVKRSSVVQSSLSSVCPPTFLRILPLLMICNLNDRKASSQVGESGAVCFSSC